MRKIPIALFLLLVAACHARSSSPSPANVGAATPGNGQPPSGIYICDGITGACNVIGIAGNGLHVVLDGTSDGGSSTTTITATGSVTTLQDSGVAVLGTVNVDPEPGSLLNTLVTQNVPAVQQVLIDAGTRCITDINYTNEGAISGYAQVFCGQYVTDAGGTAGAATVPNLQLRCPAGTVCGIKLEAPLCCAGATWYSGVDAGFLLTTSAPLLTLTAASLR